MMILAASLLLAQSTSFSGTLEISKPAQQAMALVEKINMKQSMTPAESNDLIKQVDELYGAYPIRFSMWKSWKIVAPLLAGNEAESLKQAKAYVQESDALTLNWLKDQDLTKNLLKDPAWGELFKGLEAKAAARKADMSPAAFGLDPKWTVQKLQDHLRSSQEPIHEWASQWSDFQKPKKTGWMLMFKSNGSQEYPYLVYIPKAYDPKKAHRLQMYFYGGWIGAERSRDWASKEFLNDNPLVFPKNSWEENNVIGVMPMLNRTADPGKPEGVEVIRSILTDVKMMLNVDDNRCTVAGFSDGGTTCFELARVGATDFAGLYALNGYPLFQLPYRNFGTRPLVSYSATEDDMYPIASLDRLFGIASPKCPGWKAYQVKAAGHFSMFYGDTVIPHLQQQAMAAVRNPFPTRITLEGPAETTQDWITIRRLRTNEKRETWHDDLIIKGRRSKDGPLEDIPCNAGLGMVIATRNGNHFEIQTSQVSAVELQLSPKMIDFSKPITVSVNGGKPTTATLKEDREFTAKSLLQRFDRKALPSAVVVVGTQKFE